MAFGVAQFEVRGCLVRSRPPEVSPEPVNQLRTDKLRTPNWELRTEKLRTANSEPNNSKRLFIKPPHILDGRWPRIEQAASVLHGQRNHDGNHFLAHSRVAKPRGNADLMVELFDGGNGAEG